MPNDQYSFSPSSSPEPVLNPAAEALLDRSTVLLEEIESFQRSLRRSNLEKTVELRLFLNQVKSEHRGLQGVSPFPAGSCTHWSDINKQLALELPDSTRSRHGVHASNLPYLEAVWTHAKATTGISALCKTFSYTQPGAEGGRGRDKKKKASVTVDVVAQNGLQWFPSCNPLPPDQSIDSL